MGPCPTWTTWEQWTPCSVTCGMGKRTRTRHCKGGVTGKDSECHGEVAETEPCQKGPCPMLCEWGCWTPCSTTCGPGIRKRMRACAVPGSCPPQTCSPPPSYTEAPYYKPPPAPAYQPKPSYGNPPPPRYGNPPPPSYGQQQYAPKPSYGAAPPMPYGQRPQTYGNPAPSYGNRYSGRHAREADPEPNPDPLIPPYAGTTLGGYDVTTPKVTDASYIATTPANYGANMTCVGEKETTESCNPGPCAHWTTWEQWGPCSGTVRPARYPTRQDDHCSATFSNLWSWCPDQDPNLYWRSMPGRLKRNKTV